MMHSTGRGIFNNVHTSRLDMFENIDGIFDEHGDNGANMALSALNGLAMPVVIWNHGNTKGPACTAQCHGSNPILLQVWTLFYRLIYTTV